MKTHINLLAACFLFASVLMVPQAANAITPPLGPPGACTVASLTGGFGYEIRGYADTVNVPLLPGVTVPFALVVQSQVGRWFFKGDGTFTDIFTNVIDGIQFNTDQTSGGTYTVSSDCSTVNMIVHGWYASAAFLAAGIVPNPCTHIQATIAPTAVLLGNLVYGVGLPTLGGHPLLTDAALSCTDSPTFIKSHNKANQDVDVRFTLTGTMTQQP